MAPAPRRRVFVDVRDELRETEGHVGARVGPAEFLRR